jgi:hypothetical protein
LYFAVFGAWGYVYFFSHLSHASFWIFVSVSCRVFQRIGTIPLNFG